MYLRVSLDAKGDGLAVDRQREACQSILAARGWELIGEYVDNSISATSAKKKRPGYDSLLSDLEAGMFNAVVCYDLDRLTRQPRQLEDWIDAAESGELALVTANGEADLTTDAGRLFARIKLAVARSEVERKSVRQRDAAKQRSEIGRPPLGVRLTGYTPKGDLVPDEAEIVRQVFRRFLAGDTLRGIARTLTDAGVTTRRGRPWNPSSIRTMLTNPRYAGRAVYRGEETGKRGAWEPIVDGDDFDTVQAKLSDPTRRKQVSTARKHLGSGLYLCGVCGDPLSAWSGDRYRCRGCAQVNRSQGPVDEYVTAVIVERLRSADLDGLLSERRVDTAPLLAEITKQKRLLQRAEDDYRDELIDGRLYKIARDEASAELRSAEDALAAATSATPAAFVVGSTDSGAAFMDADLMARRAVLSLLAEVRLHRGHRYSRTFDPETVSVEWKR